MNTVLGELENIGIIPVIKIDNIDNALPLATALYNGGLPCAEITFRTPEAEEAIRVISNKFPQILVGAGTVLTTEQADRAIEAGARFIVTPGLNPQVVRHCQARGVPITPGTANPGDIERALELGLDIVKFFPAEVNGGIKAIKALSAPYSSIRFIPTGGVSPDNFCSYLDLDEVLACGGSWMVPPSLINSGKFDEIETLVRSTVKTMLGFELAHIRVRPANSEKTSQTAYLLCELLGLGYSGKKNSVLTDNSIDDKNEPLPGVNGRITIRTNHLARAIHYLEGKGLSIIHETQADKANAGSAYVCLKEEISGFVIQFIQK